MRQERTVQASIFDLFAEHEIGRELKAMSQWLDEHRELLTLWRRICAGAGLRRLDDRACRRSRCYAADFSNSIAN
jgi:IS5 family transposase